MPELPEVETVVKDLQRKVLNRTFLDVWTDSPKIIKKPRKFKDFKKLLKGKKISKIYRKAKNIIFELSGGYSLLIHLKMTGHLLFGKWQEIKGEWRPLNPGFMEEKVNAYIRVMFFLDKGEMLAFSDLRKFAKTELWQTNDLKNSSEMKKLGPEPLDKSFTFRKFKEIFKNKKGRIKQVLMNQEVISGIGNIYSDEILWDAKIHPLKDISALKEKEQKKIYSAIKKILKKAVKLRGTSISDFRDSDGKPGFYGKALEVYQREGKKCRRCGVVINRLKVNGRSAHFCPCCQKD